MLRKTNVRRNLKGILLLFIGILVSTGSFSQRKKVGLVLSGGGAKGVAHIGVLKVLEEAQLPIDYICGTSMGAIVGGLYAIGYNATTLDSIVSRQNWRNLLGDQVDRSDLPFVSKEMSERYLLSLPLSRKKIKVPAGMISGQNIYNLLTELSLGYHKDMNFLDLPIPFYCVAADLVSGDEVVLKDGLLPEAMRASMAIPGVFAPIRKDSMVLVDGGIANNFPVDICKKMGADIIIAIDLSTGTEKYEDIDNLPSVLNQMTYIMGKNKYLNNMDQVLKDTMCSLYLNPNLQGYSAASFSGAAIDTMINMGEQVARRNYYKILQLKKKVYESAKENLHYSVPTQNKLRTDSLAIARIFIEGVEEGDQQWIKRFLTLKEYSVITFNELNRNLAYFYGTGAFSHVSYQMKGADIYDLHLIFTRRPSNSINVGIRFDTEEMASIILNTTLTNRYLRGSRLSLTTRLNINPYVKVDYSFGNPFLRRLGLAYQYQYNNIDLYEHGEKVDNITFAYNKGQLSYYDLYFKNLKSEIGFRYEYFDFGKFLYSSDYDKQKANSKGYFTYYIAALVESLDAKYFPHKGIMVNTDISLMTTNLTQNDGKSPFMAIKTIVTKPIRITKRVYTIPSFFGRVLIGQDIPFQYLNAVGGEVAGRFFEQQLPFVGIQNVGLFDNSILILQNNLRYRFGSNHYLSLLANYAKQDDQFMDILKGENLWGIGAKYSYNTLIGPFELLVDYSNWQKKLGVYLNVGYYF